MASPTSVCQWRHGRFEVATDVDEVILRDWLMPAARRVSAERFKGLAGQALAQSWFLNGLVPGALGAALDMVADRPRDHEDPLFWQYPCRTEGAAWDLHADLSGPGHFGDEVNIYLGLPWATWIDKERKCAWGSAGKLRADVQWNRTRVRLLGLHAALHDVGLRLRVHTVCQHIHWRDLVPSWEALGVTDLWLSHCPSGVEHVRGLQVHPWRLFAVNVEDESRRYGLDIGRDPAKRSLLASFVGAHADHYLSDIRLRLLGLAQEPDFHVEVTGRWHFERVVYEEQVQGHAGTPAGVDESVLSYNRLLSDSVFSLCPAGAGANTLRLWESLASGAIPVLLGHWPRLPAVGTLPSSDWDDVVIRVSDEELSQLPSRLRAIPLAERRSRQAKGLVVFDAVRSQRCF